MGDFLDGTSNTLMVVEVQRDVHWAKPDDIVWNPAMPLPDFGGFKAGQFLALRADGAVGAFKSSWGYANAAGEPQWKKDLRHMFTIQDRNPVNEATLRASSN